MPDYLPSTHSLITLDQNWCSLLKNLLKRLKIKEGTTSKVNYILFSRLLSIVLLNKHSLAQAKAVNNSYNISNKCFSNYYQV